MDTNVKNLQEVFQTGQRLLVPLFQRPYVWNEERQWAPLWEDVQRLADSIADGEDPEPHFLGAIVLQKVAGATAVQSRTVIDGQQRLTTLQLLFHAAFLELKAQGMQEAEYLRAHFRNSEPFLPPSDRFKLTPTTRDQAEYEYVIRQGDETHQYAFGDDVRGSLVDAHTYFRTKIESWLLGEVTEKSQHLTRALMHKLNLVSIELEHNEDSQQIFETLNARGTPLSGADLIKNFVFQRLAADGADTEEMYKKFWSQFETGFWEKSVSIGRVPAPRISLFLSHWVIARTGREVPIQEVFRKFKLFADAQSTQTKMPEMLSEIDASALRYRAWNEGSWVKAGDLSRLELLVYRTSVLGTQSAGPILLWATDPTKSPVPSAQLEKLFRSLESWLIRRAFMRSGNAGIGQFIADLIAQLDQSSRDVAGDRLSQLLVEASAPNLAWPSNDDIITELSQAPVYTRFRRPFTRMILEALEDFHRGYCTAKASFAEGRVQRDSHSIEHLLPQAWGEKWSVGRDLGAQIERDKHVHRLGNLTLVAGGLNSKINNGPWLGAKGKLSALNQHSVLLLNQKVTELGSLGWSEELINQRTQTMLQVLLEVWPVPPEALGVTQADVREGSDHDVSVKDLLHAGLLQINQELYPRSAEQGIRAKVLSNGFIAVLDEPFDTPSGAGRRVTKRSTNGWTFWVVDREQGVDLSALRSQLVRSRLSSPPTSHESARRS